MEVIIMGTSSSPGSPMIASENEWLDLDDKRNWRTRSAIHVVMDGIHIQVDTGPEFRMQCLWNRIEALDLIIITHEHSDHTSGLDDIRRYCTMRGEAIPLYSTERGLKRVKDVYYYGVGAKPKRTGYMAVMPQSMPAVLETAGGTIASVLLPHGKTEVLGRMAFDDCEPWRLWG